MRFLLVAALMAGCGSAEPVDERAITGPVPLAERPPAPVVVRTELPERGLAIFAVEEFVDGCHAVTRATHVYRQLGGGRAFIGGFLDGAPAGGAWAVVRYDAAPPVTRTVQACLGAYLPPVEVVVDAVMLERRDAATEAEAQVILAGMRDADPPPRFGRGVFRTISATSSCDPERITDVFSEIDSGLLTIIRERGPGEPPLGPFAVIDYETTAAVSRSFSPHECFHVPAVTLLETARAREIRPVLDLASGQRLVAR